MKLKARAVEIGLAQRSIAEAMGVSDPTISAWLRGDRRVPLEHADKLAALLRLPVSAILRRPVGKTKPLTTEGKHQTT